MLTEQYLYPVLFTANEILDLIDFFKGLRDWNSIFLLPVIVKVVSSSFSAVLLLKKLAISFSHLAK